jgi:hypothetical protein
LVTTQGCERTFAQAVEVNVRAALLQARSRLEHLQPRQLLAGELREPLVEILVLDCWRALGHVSPARPRLYGSQLLGETPVLRPWTYRVRELFAPHIVRLCVASFRSAPIRIRLSSIPGAVIV